ncbi:MAG: TIM barrel protein [Chloroflexota bacterium]
MHPLEGMYIALFGREHSDAERGHSVCPVWWLRDLTLIGLGLSDITPEYRGDLSLVEREGLTVLELQPELETWHARRLKGSYRLLAVHAASQGRDIASPDANHRSFAVKEAKRDMVFAHLGGADSFLLHPGHILSPSNIAGIVEEADYPFVSAYYWEHPERRCVRIQMFLESLSELAAFYEQEGFRFEITLENLPFPNLCATTAELLSVYRLSRLRLPLKITLDVPHLWVSFLLLRDNPWLRGLVEGYLDSARAFYADLEGFVAANEDVVAYYHIYGTRGLEEHLPISLKRRYGTDELDLRRVARTIGDRRPIILEVFNVPQSAVRRSISNFERLLRE